MMNTILATLRTLALVAAAAALLLSLGVASNAQQESGERGYVELGGRFFDGDRSSSKFSEYRDLNKGFFVRRLDLDLDSILSHRYFLHYRTRQTILKDQSHLLDAGRYGRFRFQFRWDQEPHYFSNTARTLFRESSPGVFTIPETVRSTLQTTPGELPSFLSGTPLIYPRLRRHIGASSFTYTPTDDWTFQFQYSREKQTGSRPFGTTTNSFTTQLEFPEPIDYRTHAITASAEYAKTRWGVQFNYSGSIFNNKVSELVWDNPFRLTDALNGTSRGRLDLYPDNTAHIITIAGAVNLFKSTRLMASIARGWMFQDDPFLPFTINSAVTGVPALPASSLKGEKDTLAMNYTLSSSAIPHLPLTVRYRSYDLDNDTPSLTFSDYVRTDGSLGGAVRRSLPYEFNRKNLDASVSWEFMKNSAVKFGYEWERYERKHRDAERTDEHSAGVSIDFVPKNWLLLRTSYRHSNRLPTSYEANEESFPLGEGPTALGQIEGLRKFDEARRGRDRAEALVQIDPTDTLSFSASYGTIQDDYNQSLFGMAKEINYNYGFDFTYSPHPAFSFFGEFTREKYKSNQRSRQRVPPARIGAPPNDSPNNDWVSDLRDFIDTWAGGIDGSFSHDLVRYEAYYSLSGAEGTIHTRALGTPSVAGFLVTTAQDYPNTVNRFHQVVTSVRFRLHRDVYPRFEYRYEKYGSTDFQNDPVRQFMFGVDPSTNRSAFLGARVPGFGVHIFSFTVGYRF